MIFLKLSPEWRCSPIFKEGDYNVLEGSVVNPEELPIGPTLRKRIWDWADKFDTFLDWNDPGSPKELDQNEVKRFLEEGKSLTEILQNELGDTYSVRFSPPLWL